MCVNSTLYTVHGSYSSVLNRRPLHQHGGVSIFQKESIDEDHIPLRGLTGERASVVLFGDSLTQRGWGEGGWCSSVADLFQRRADVYNRGYGGYNSRWARYLVPHLFNLAGEIPSIKHFLVVVWFGANDAAHPSENSYVPLEEYAENVRAILAHVQEVCHFFYH